jgi:hypothetical protein
MIALKDPMKAAVCVLTIFLGVPGPLRVKTKFLQRSLTSPGHRGGIATGSRATRRRWWAFLTSSDSRTVRRSRRTS